MLNPKIKKWLFARRFVQLSILTLFIITPYAGVKIIEGTLTSARIFNVVPMTDPLAGLQVILASGGMQTTAIIGMILVLSLYVIMGGRAFCAWVCPLNMVTDTAHWLAKSLNLRKGRKLAREMRLWILATILIVSALTGVVAFEMVNPISILHRGLFFGMGMGWVFILGIFLFDLLLFSRGWCSHLCPVGAFYSIVGRISLTRVRFQQQLCDHCGDCYKVCPEPHVLNSPVRDKVPVVLSGDCTNCGSCIDICPTRALKFGTRFH